MVQIKPPASPIELRNYINGAWCAASGKKFDVQSPVNGAVIGHSKATTLDDLAKVVAAAKEAQPSWGSMPIKERSKIMFSLRQVLLRELDTIANLVGSESGKTFDEAKAGVLKGIEVLEFAISLQNLDMGGRVQVSRGVSCEYRREAVGVVAGVTPFNFPAMVPMWMLPIAITLGNAFIWKPSDKTPLTSKLIADAFAEAGLPPGVLNVVQGGRETVEAILDADGVDAVGFVGSTAVAKSVYSRGCGHGKRVLALGGAKNHMVLMPDADTEMASSGILASFTGCAGQRCMAGSVLVAVGDCDATLAKLEAKAKEVRLGEGMGAIINKESLNRLENAIATAKSEGAHIRIDGRKPQAPTGFEGGNWLAPTILDHVQPGSEAATVELFGPVLSIVRVDTLSEALALEKQSHYGNAASIFTQNGAVAERFSEDASAGMVGVNVGVPVPREPFSFGGINASKFGHGDITGHGSLDFWSNQKKVTVKWAQQSDQNWMS